MKCCLDIYVKKIDDGFHYIVHDTTVGNIYYEIFLNKYMYTNASTNLISEITSTNFVFQSYSAKNKSKFLPLSFLNTDKYGIVFNYGLVDYNKLLIRVDNGWKTVDEENLTGSYFDLSSSEGKACIDENKDMCLIGSKINNYVMHDAQTNMVNFTKGVHIIYEQNDNAICKIYNMDEFISTFSFLSLDILSMSKVPEIMSTLNMGNL
jgi:hypothetical protein